MAKPRKVDESPALLVSDDEFKDVLHETIDRMVREKTDRKLGKDTAKRILDRMVEMIFKRVVETGYFRFPNGYGSLKLGKLKENAAAKKMPSGEVVTPKPHRFKVKYKDGVAVMDMLGTNPHKYKRKTPRHKDSEGSGTATV